ncbi:MAG: hypothetical protein WBH56_00985 [Bacteroidota bacterium]
MSRIQKLTVVWAGLLILFSPRALGQETYYWNIQYGTRSTLLGGAVIGSASDLSATYYNPGAVALFDDPKFILSALVYQLDTYTVKEGAGEGLDLAFTNLVPSPSFVAFDFGFDFLGNDRLAVSVLTRQSADFEFGTRIIDSIDVIGSSPGKEDFAGGFNTKKGFDDVWGGITYSTKLGKSLGLGFTWYFGYVGSRFGSQTILQALQSTGDIASYTDISDYRFYNLRTLVKAGVGLNLKPLTLGFTVTTGSMHILGTGSAGTHLFLAGVDSTIFQSNYQEDVSSQFRSPWAIGVGGAYRFGMVNLHLSGEWYGAIEEYTVLDTEPYVAQGSGETLTNDLTHETKSVTNFGLGVDFFVTEKTIVSAGFVTDFSARVPDTQTNLSTASSWDIYHISAGVTFPLGKSDFTLGLAYSFGSDTFENNIDLTPGPDDVTRDSKMVFSRIKVLLGFQI